jgi:hypothetical protein
MGDELLVAGEARRLQEADPRRRPVVVHDRHGRPRWHMLWQANPRILRPEQVRSRRGDSYINLTNGAGCRAYADYDRMKREFAAVFPGVKYNPASSAWHRAATW